MKILYLPFNIASMQAITNQAVNKVDGVRSICFNTGRNKVNSGKDKFSSGKDMIELYNPSRKQIFLYIKWVFQKYYYFFKLIFWADVVHYVWDSFLVADVDLHIVKWLKKPGVVEWVGSDIRSPSVSFIVNPYLKNIYNSGYEYAHLEKDENSKKVQLKFSKVRLEPVAVPEMQLYIDKSLFPVRHVVLQRINVSAFEPTYPDAHNKRPLIVHSPTAKIAKGSNIIINVIEELKKSYDFDFVSLENMQHDKVLDIIKKADIFIDQINFGSHGMAALEAMSYGKPVMCYLMPKIFDEGFPAECPIVNTNQENISEQLIKLISDPQLRYSLGISSRKYVEKYHDADKIAYQLIDIYRGAIRRRSTQN